MGQRANLILIEGGRHTVYYTHWRANTLPTDLFWGPGYALRFFRVQRLIEDGSLLDQVWAEGGAVLDLDAKVLLLFGGEDVACDVPLRRVYLRLARHIWDGWDVRWANEGVADITDYLELPRSLVLCPQELRHWYHDLSPPAERRWVNSVGTIRFEDGPLRVFPLAFSNERLTIGPHVLTTLEPSAGLERLNFAEWASEFPREGFHIDVARRTVEFWTGWDDPDAPARVAAVWPDWTVAWHRDRYESHLAAAGPALAFPRPDQDVLLSRVREIVLVEEQRSGPEMVLDMVQRLDSEGTQDPKISEYATRDARLLLSREERVRIVNSAVEEFRRLP